ncbi:hypothetical protein NXH67_09050 [Butyrivibrio sp. DSM 10294]|jgi:hypothetical protein|uniref:hypothetical protein n=1 Tax=Butyrivibrio sp. DSM 10294 TaxID=2972457 RepID=UPI00234EE4E5|nr:hypothetical protein [Butyrivibrio sp. DSM 10294]MDC7293663.1 hypothetical protein [Butyrivibrio sp. DSM 10294]
MDSKVFRMALLTIISVFALIAVIVYATNADKIGGLFGKKGNNAATGESSEAVSLTLAEEAYGEQIGDNLNGFLYDEDFFDETEKVPSVVVIKKSSASSEATEEAAYESSEMEEDTAGTGMAIVGQLENPDAEAGADISNEGASLPSVIPVSDSVEGTSGAH